MTALRKLDLTGYEAQFVLLPGPEGSDVPRKCVRITVFGAVFPIRAVEPEILVGRQRVEDVQVAHDQRSIRGYLRELPPEGSVILVRYGDSQQGRLRLRFQARRVKSLPRVCR